MNLATLTLMLSVSCYAPASGDGISGGMQTASGAPVANWIAACPNWLAIGTVIELPALADGGSSHPDGVTARVTCGDRFHPDHANGYNLDLAIAPTGPENTADRRRRWRECITWGRRTMQVKATRPPESFKFVWGEHALTPFRPELRARVNRWSHYDH